VKSTGSQSLFRERANGWRLVAACGVTRLFRPRPKRYRVAVAQPVVPWQRPGPIHVLLLVPLLVLGAWVWQRGKATSPDRGAVLAALRAARGPALPEAVAVGALLRTEPARYDRETLYEAIDGAADAYIARRFVSALMATYTFRGEEGALPAEVSAELHRFETEAGALAQRDAERPAAAKAVAGLPDAEADGSVLVAVRGRNYLKLTVLTALPAAPGGMDKTLFALGRAVLQERTP